MCSRHMEYLQVISSVKLHSPKIIEQLYPFKSIRIQQILFFVEVDSFPRISLEHNIQNHAEKWKSRFISLESRKCLSMCKVKVNYYHRNWLGKKKKLLAFKVSRLLSSLFSCRSLQTNGNKEDFISLQYFFRFATLCGFKSVL